MCVLVLPPPFADEEVEVGQSLLVLSETAKLVNRTGIMRSVTQDKLSPRTDLTEII